MKKTTVAIVPIGALHDHGQTPVGIDCLASTTIANRLASKTNALVLPPMNYGPTDSYMSSHPGSINVSKKCVYEMALGICESLYHWGMRKVLFVNGHGGCTPPLEDVAKIMSFGERRMLVAIVEWWNLIKEGIHKPSYEIISTHLKDDKHVSANFIEAATALAIDPTLVDTDKIRTVALKKILGPNVVPTRTTTVRFENGTIRMIFKNKDLEEDVQKLSFANKEIGTQMLDTVTDYLVRFVAEFEKMQVPK